MIDSVPFQESGAEISEDVMSLTVNETLLPLKGYQYDLEHYIFTKSNLFTVLHLLICWDDPSLDCCSVLD